MKCTLEVRVAAYSQMKALRKAKTEQAERKTRAKTKVA
jgi:hypothetical protein